MATKTDTIRKREDGNGWQYLHPSSGQWTGNAGQITSRDAARAARTAANPYHIRAGKKTVDNTATSVASSSPVSSAVADTTSPQNTGTDAPAAKDTKIMQITLTKSTKTRKSTSVVYTAGALRGSARFAKTFFKDGNAPDTIVIDSDAFAEPKKKLTAEERKAARKDAPKLSPAEKLAKLQERSKKLEEKIAKEAAAAAAPPASA
jgi:hypothetical protein